MIPKQLQNPEFRFVKLQASSKKPFEKDWQEKGYSYDDKSLLKHISKGGNYGVIGGYGNLRILDIDNKELADNLKQSLNTFAVRTGSGGLHFYFISDYGKNHVLTDKRGELRANNYQVVGPGCKHPNGNFYVLEEDKPIRNLPQDELQALIAPYIRGDSPGSPTNSDKGKDTSRSGKEFREILKLLKKGLTKEEIYGEMVAYSKWAGAGEAYRETTYKNALAVFQTPQKDHTKELITASKSIEDSDFIKNIYFDEHGIFWIWNNEVLIWEMKDETDILNFFEKNGIQTKLSRYKTLALNLARQEGRKNKPKEPPSYSIVFRDVIFDLKNNTKIPIVRDYFITHSIPYKLSDRSETPIIDKLFFEWVGEDKKELLYEIIAYCCLREQFLQRWFALTGAGSNGKGTYNNLIKQFIGKDNCVSSSVKSLINRSFETSALYKKLVCFIGEAESSDLSNTNLIKQLTGEDLIRYEFKGKTCFSEISPTTFIMNTNSLPKTPDKSDGFYRRVQVIPFPNQFDINPRLLEDIPKVEFENLTRRVVDAGLRLIAQNKFTGEGTISERRKNYEAHSNPLMIFITEECEEEGAAFYKLRDFTKEYNKFRQNRKLRVLSAHQVGKELREEGFDISSRKYKDKDGEVIDSQRSVIGLTLRGDYRYIAESSGFGGSETQKPPKPPFLTIQQETPPVLDYGCEVIKIK